MADAGFKLAVEGEKEFKKAISEINAQIKANAAELKLLTAQYDANDKSMTALNDRQGVLEQGLAAQGQKVSALREQYEKMSAVYGENDTKVLKLRTELANAGAEYAKLSKEIEANQAAIDENWKAMENYQEVTSRVGDTLGGLDDIMADNRKEIEKLAEEYKTLGDSSKTAADRQDNLVKQNERLADSAEAQKKKLDALNEQLDAAVRLYGENSTEVAEYRDAVNKANGELDQMEQQIRDNNDAMSQSGDAVSPLGGALSGILDQLGIQMPAELDNLTTKGFPAAATAAGLITAAIVGALGKLAELTAEAAAWADEMERKSQTTGIDSEQLQALEYAGSKLGVEMEVIEDVIKEIGIKSGETNDAILSVKQNTEDWNSMDVNSRRALLEEEAGVWHDLGVNIYDASGQIKPAEELFYELIDALGNVTNESERLSIMNGLLGESSKDLMPFINAGKDAIKALEDEARELGVVIDEDTIGALDDFRKEIDEATKKWDAFKIQLGNVGRESLELIRGEGGFDDLREAVKDTMTPLNALTDQLVGKSVGTIVWENTPIGGFISMLKTAYGWITDLFNIGGKSKETEIPAYANGTYNHPGGYALVGERGPEVVELPRGSRVYPNGQAPVSSVVNQYNITVDAKNVKELNDIVRIAENEKRSIRMGYIKD